MKTVNKLFVWLNSISLITMLFLNYGSNSGLFGNTTVGDISHRYDTLFAPANYAFAIWGVIFLGLIAFTVYQWVLLKRGDPRKYIARTGIWFLVSNLANGLWIVAWINDQIGLSVLLILLLLFSLIILTFRLRLEMDDEPVQTIFFVWWPIVFYLGWIVSATVACISAWLVSVGWHGGPLSESAWTIILIIIAALIYLMLIARRNMREAALVGAWAFVAISIRQWDGQNAIAITAAAAAFVMLLAGGLHGYRNRAFGVGEKIKKGEWK